MIMSTFKSGSGIDLFRAWRWMMDPTSVSARMPLVFDAFEKNVQKIQLRLVVATIREASAKSPDGLSAEPPR